MWGRHSSPVFFIHEPSSARVCMSLCVCVLSRREKPPRAKRGKANFEGAPANNASHMVMLLLSFSYALASFAPLSTEFCGGTLEDGKAYKTRHGGIVVMVFDC